MIKWGGIEFSLHPLFIMVMLASIFTGHFIEMITLFAIVLVHELGHAAAARSFGWEVKEIKLLPFGGVAVMDESGRGSAWEEIAIAIAGPLQNALMIIVGWAAFRLGWWDAEWTSYFIKANAVIALFNLLPVLPLDGGRIVHSLFSLWFPYHRTMIWSFRLSVAFSGLIVGYAVLPLFRHGEIELNLLVIGLFLLYSNWYDYRNIPYRFVRFMVGRERLASAQIRRGVAAVPIVVHAAQPLQDVLRLFMRGKYHVVYVMNGHGKIVAVLPEQRLIDSYFAKEI
ncbi:MULTISPECIES: M50 family metallopeptidase [unclassified Paenibacillus]|uniref:M50 family metallopeptidase n=1 Tax=unclassified Paenibacillus TaxID=185978 RepID=UPI001C11E160|nr:MULTISPECIES: M50 family metallopeptidase [unclassified Paenibacillus]MBU5444662.1 M50 family metallopeptidase [Paenibacillus sp. MSJ-34]CAH0119122.1 Stage IV sporulation protein FB [Paenibacillus sp. CECT 9249]